MQQLGVKPAYLQEELLDDVPDGFVSDLVLSGDVGKLLKPGRISWLVSHFDEWKCITDVLQQDVELIRVHGVRPAGDESMDGGNLALGAQDRQSSRKGALVHDTAWAQHFAATQLRAAKMRRARAPRRGHGRHFAAPAGATRARQNGAQTQLVRPRSHQHSHGKQEGHLWRTLVKSALQGSPCCFPRRLL